MVIEESLHAFKVIVEEHQQQQQKRSTVKNFIWFSIFFFLERQNKNKT